MSVLSAIVLAVLAVSVGVQLAARRLRHAVAGGRDETQAFVRFYGLRALRNLLLASLMVATAARANGLERLVAVLGAALILLLTLLQAPTTRRVQSAGREG